MLKPVIWAIWPGFGQRNKEPDVYIYPLAMVPAKKNALNFEFFSFSFIFFGMVVSGRFFTLLDPFWTLVGGKNSLKYDHI